jgi:hypothetical protein
VGAGILGCLVVRRPVGRSLLDLVVSERTVSTQLSSMLRTTGTTNRVDLTQVAMRGE